MRHNILLSFFTLVLTLFPLALKASSYEVQEMSILSVNSAITPATYDYLKHQFARLKEGSLVILKMNTPGGLVTTTKDIITLVGKYKFPLVVWITPEGASASSAGAIIASAAHFIIMAPGSNMGAATPVGLGEDLKESDGRSKALNDLTALVRSLNISRGRPAAPFEEMIKTAASYTDKEALNLKIIDGVVSKQTELITLLKGKTFFLQGQEQTLTFKTGFTSQEHGPTIGQKILEVLANPSTAYFLFLIGVALIYFEFQAPGGFIAGSVGVCFIILAAIAFQVLPLDWGAFGLILVGIVLFILEIFITSYGVLSFAGLSAFIMGSLFLFHGEGGFISVEYPVLFSTLAGVLVAVGIIVWYIYKDQKKQGKPENFFMPIGSLGFVMTKNQVTKFYQIKVRGEIWKASSETELQIGDTVEVTSIDQQSLLVLIKKV